MLANRARSGLVVSMRARTRTHTSSGYSFLMRTDIQIQAHGNTRKLAYTHASPNTKVWTDILVRFLSKMNGTNERAATTKHNVGLPVSSFIHMESCMRMGSWTWASILTLIAWALLVCAGIFTLVCDRRTGMKEKWGKNNTPTWESQCQTADLLHCGCF